MIKRFFTLAMLAGAITMADAQVAKLGFEASEANNQYSTAEALTPGLSKFGDWVNPKAEDMWNEENTSDVRSGEFCLLASNGDAGGDYFSWDRGFKIGNLSIDPHTSYRVSFWMKAPEGAKLTSQLGVGVENMDCSFTSPGCNDYSFNETNNFIFNDEWTHYSYVAYFTDMATQNQVLEAGGSHNRSWIGNSTFPEALGGDGTTTYLEHYKDQETGAYSFPNKFFAIFCMYSPDAEYLIDDIVIEKNVAFNNIYFCNDVIRLDFGYPTSIAALAKASEDGFAHFDPSCITVMKGGVQVPVEYLEGHGDGYLYAFLPEGSELDAEDEITVSLNTPDEIVYNNEKRPADYVSGDADMPAVDVVNEPAYYNEKVGEVFSSAWTAPEFVSSVPENNSFELDAATLKEVTFKYNKAIDLTYASATLKSNGMEIANLSDVMSVKEDDNTVLVISLANVSLQDGEYEIVVSDIANEVGMPCETTQSLAFAVGEDTDESESVTVYSTDETFANTQSDTFPKGWLSNDNGTIHEYGVYEDGTIYNYSWSPRNPLNAGGGCRAFTGYSGDINGGAIYWRNFNAPATSGTLTFGEQVNDFVLSDGSIDPAMDPEIALPLSPNKYQITIRMCAWKNLNGNTEEFSNDPNVIPTYSFTLEDLNGKVFAEFNNIPAKPNVNGATGRAVNNITKSQADFTVSKEGYYVLKFSAQSGAELLLGGVDIITMPSKAAYYKQLLRAALAPAEEALANAEDAKYNGDTKTALAAEIEKAKTTKFHQPSEIAAEIAALKELCATLSQRISNIDGFAAAIQSASDALSTLEGTNYETTPEYIDGKALYDQYKDVNPTDLSDETLNTVVPQLTGIADQLGKAQSYADILAYRGKTVATDLALSLGINDESLNVLAGAVTDDTETINKLNALSTAKLYELIAANNNALPESLCEEIEYSDPETVCGQPEWVVYDEAADKFSTAVKGINVTAFVNNPHLYRVNGDNGVPGWTITPGSEGANTNIGFDSNPDASNRVVDPRINIYGDANYDMSQVIENLPAGIYTLVVATRTPRVDKTGEASETYPEDQKKIHYYNAQNEEGVWDKYIYANNGTEEVVAPYIGAGGLTNTFATEIKAVDGKLTIGAHEAYVSGKAIKHEDGTPQSFWTGTTYLDDVRLYLIGTDPEFNYAEAATGIQNIENEKASTFGVKYNVAGQAVGADFKGVVIMNGKKYLAK